MKTGNALKFFMGGGAGGCFIGGGGKVDVMWAVPEKHIFNIFWSYYEYQRQLNNITNKEIQYNL